MRAKYLVRSKEVGDETAFGIRWCAAKKELMIAGPISQKELFEVIVCAFGVTLKTAERQVKWSWRLRAEWLNICEEDFTEGISTLMEEWYVDKVRSFRRLTR